MPRDGELPGVGRPADPLVRAAELGTWASASLALQDVRARAEEMMSAARAAREAERRRGHAEGYAAGAEQAARLIAAATAEAAAATTWRSARRRSAGIGTPAVHRAAVRPGADVGEVVVATVQACAQGAPGPVAQGVRLVDAGVKAGRRRAQHRSRPEGGERGRLAVQLRDERPATPGPSRVDAALLFLEVRDDA